MKRPVMSPRALVAIAIATATATAIVGCSSSSSGSTSNAAKNVPGLIKQGQLSVCNSSSNYPPMYSDATGTFKGVTPDIADAIAKRLGVRATFSRSDFQGLVPAAQAGRCDLLMSSLYLTPERLKALNGIPYMTTGWTLVVPKGNPGDINTIADLSGKTVAVQRSTSQQLELEDINKQFSSNGKTQLTIQAYNDPTSEVTAIRNKKADAFIETGAFGNYLAKTNGADMQTVPNLFKPNAKVAIYYKNPKLTTPLTNALAAMYKEKQTQGILKDHSLDPQAALSIVTK